MLKIYCRSCGAPTEYSINKPKLCCQCGTSFASISSFTPSPPRTVSLPKNILKNRTKVEEELDIDSESDFESQADLITEVPEIEKLDFELIGNKVQGIKLGNIVGTSSAPTTYEEPKNVKVFSKKEVLEQFRRDAGKTSKIELGDNDSE